MARKSEAVIRVEKRGGLGVKRPKKFHTVSEVTHYGVCPWRRDHRIQAKDRTYCYACRWEVCRPCGEGLELYGRIYCARCYQAKDRKIQRLLSPTKGKLKLIKE